MLVPGFSSYKTIGDKMKIINDNHIKICKYSTWDVMWKEKGTGELINAGNSYCNPTHWMPLPDAPEELCTHPEK